MLLSHGERRNMGVFGYKHMEEIFDKRKVVKEHFCNSLKTPIE